jgi:hypothetical protein
VHHALMSGALPKRELLWHMRRVAATPPYAGKLTPTWAAQVGLSGGYDRTHQCPSSLLGTKYYLRCVARMTVLGAAAHIIARLFWRGATLRGPHDSTLAAHIIVLSATHRGPPCTAVCCRSHQYRAALTAAHRDLPSASY